MQWFERVQQFRIGHVIGATDFQTVGIAARDGDAQALAELMHHKSLRFVGAIQPVKRAAGNLLGGVDNVLQGGGGGSGTFEQEAAIGVAECFAVEEIIGRWEVEPKPSPAGLRFFAERWNVAPAAMRMVGDHYYDLATAKAAGVPGILINVPDDPWPGMAQWQLRDCAQLLQQWRRPAFR